MENKNLENKVENLEELADKDMEDVSGGISKYRIAENNKNEQNEKAQNDKGARVSRFKGNVGKRKYRADKKDKADALKSVRGANEKNISPI